MNLIRTRNNKIYFDFCYTCPKTGKTKRCRTSTQLSDSKSNRAKAKKMAIEKLNALLHSEPQKPEPKLSEQPIIQTSKPKSESKEETTLSEFVAYYKTRKKYLDRAKKTKQLYDMYLRLYILPDLAEIRLKDIDADAIEDFETILQNRGLTAKTVRDSIGYLKNLLNFAVRRKYLPYAPQYTCSYKQKKKQPRAFSEDERAKFLEHLKENEGYYYPIICFTLYTGVRMSEARGLTWGDVKLSHAVPQVRIHRTIDIDGTFKGTKTNQERNIPLCSLLVEILNKLRKSALKTGIDDFVFLSVQGEPLPKRTLDKLMRRSCPRAGVKYISFHGLRHTFATLVTNKHGVAKASKLLGHADISTTMIYYHEDQQVLLSVIEDL